MRAMSRLTNFWEAFRRERIAVVGLSLILLVLLMGLSAPLINPYQPSAMNLFEAYLPPSARHWFGTDGVGRDLLSRAMWGARTSLTVATIGMIVSTTIGVALGAISGYFRRLDMLIMRFTDIVLTFPSFFLLIVVSALLEVKDLFSIAFIIGCIGWTGMARLVRAEFLSIRELDYVEAAKAIGTPTVRIIVLHMLPNCVAPILVSATLGLARYILYEAAISFIGLGDPTAISWGTIMGRGQEVLRTAWWITVFPGLFIFITVLAFNLCGDGLRDAFDPRIYRQKR